MGTTPMARVWSRLESATAAAADQISRVLPGLLIGGAAGAAGTTTLNVITYLDIAVRGRPASTTPERTVEALARLFDLTVPGTGDALANRLAGLGALTGYAAGIGIGLILGLAYSLGWRPGLLIATLVATALALFGTNGPIIALGVTDPRTWGVVGWISDPIPHFGYGVVTALVLHYFYPLSRPSTEIRRRGASAHHHLDRIATRRRRPEEGSQSERGLSTARAARRRATG
jgi:hypothetical protein